MKKALFLTVIDVCGGFGFYAGRSPFYGGRFLRDKSLINVPRSLSSQAQLLEITVSDLTDKLMWLKSQTETFHGA